MFGGPFMARVFWLVIALAMLCARSANAESVILCGADTVFVVKTEAITGGKTAKAWSWNAKQCEQLPEAVRRTFATTDDCKPVDGGSRILISSSSGGCVLIERPSGKVIWYAVVPNAHSLELLPCARIAVASSVSANGDRLIVFDIAHSDQPIADTPLPAAHGVVWDEGREVLWALGLKELRCYELQDWQGKRPSLKMKAAYPLSDQSGHDLQPIPNSNDLVVTTGRHVFLFDRDRREFRPHGDLGDSKDIKSVNVHPRTGQTVFIQATESWWSDRLGLLNPAGKLQLPGERLYKARWLLESPATDLP
jgi:hypothetical protein